MLVEHKSNMESLSGKYFKNELRGRKEGVNNYNYTQTEAKEKKNHVFESIKRFKPTQENHTESLIFPEVSSYFAMQEKLAQLSSDQTLQNSNSESLDLAPSNITFFPKKQESGKKILEKAMKIKKELFHYIENAWSVQNSRVPQINDLVYNRYRISQLLGSGSFGQVYQAYDLRLNQFVALKMIKAQCGEQTSQTDVEVELLKFLNQKDKSHNYVVKVMDTFRFWNHQYIVFELLETNLYDYLEKTNGQGFSCQFIRTISRKLIYCLMFLKEARIVHCDLKPENIMFSQDCVGLVKLVDFGSSCRLGNQIFNYIQSRFYRAPEVILGMKYGCEIDIWSMGCLLVELAVCDPLFCGKNEVDQLGKIMEYFGMPPQSMLCASTKLSIFFRVTTNELIFNSSDSSEFSGYSSKSLFQFIGKTYPGGLFGNDRQEHYNFFSFLSSMLIISPTERFSPSELMIHPFLFDIKSMVLPPMKNHESEDHTSQILMNQVPPLLNMDLNLLNYYNKNYGYLLSEESNYTFVIIDQKNKISDKIIHRDSFSIKGYTYANNTIPPSVGCYCIDCINGR